MQQLAIKIKQLQDEKAMLRQVEAMQHQARSHIRSHTGRKISLAEAVYRGKGFFGLPECSYT